MRNVQTGETGNLYPEGPESRFEFMLYVDREEGEPHELGYWEEHEWRRDGWVYAEDREPAALMRGGARKHEPGTREFFRALGIPYPIRAAPSRGMGQR